MHQIVDQQKIQYEDHAKSIIDDKTTIIDGNTELNTITEEKEETGSTMMLQPLFESPERKNGEFNVALETKKL